MSIKRRCWRRVPCRERMPAALRNGSWDADEFWCGATQAHSIRRGRCVNENRRTGELADTGRMPVPRKSLAFQSIPPGDGFEFDADGVFDGDDGAGFEHECGEHGTEFVDGELIVAVEQHVAPPVANANHEHFDFEIGGG